MAVYGIRDISTLELLNIVEWDGSSSFSLLPGHELYSGSLTASYTGSSAIIDPLTVPVTGSFTGSYTGSFYGLVIGSGSFTGSFTGSLTGSLTGSVSGSDKMSFSTSANQTVLAGEMAWDDGNGTLDIGLKGGNINLAVGQQTFARCYNAEGTTLTKGTIVYISGSQGNRVAVKRADYSGEVGSSTTLGFVAETITSGAEGFVITNGRLEKINTTGLIEGEMLYLSSSGQYTHTKPVAPNHTVVLGYVERLHATVGSIYVKIDNGYELGELHNVLTNGVTNGDLLAYSGSVWTHSKQLSGSYGVTGSMNITGSLTVDSPSPITLMASNLVLGTASGDEGGEILLVKPQTNATYTGSGITIDAYQNRIRFFEQGGAARGAYLDITQLGAGVSTNLLTSGTSGTSGGTGASGTSGTSGQDGVSGTSGTSGTRGSSGTSGTSGTTGTSGSSGTSGTTGSSGTSGIAGTSGTAGTSGGTGVSGTSGTSGTGFSTVTNFGDNRILTSDGTSNAAIAESNITFDGSVLSITGSMNMATGSLVNPLLVGYYENIVSRSIASDYAGGIVNIDLRAGNVYKITLNGNIMDFNIQNNPISTHAGSFTLMLIGDGTPRTVSWGTEVIWPNGAPTIVSTAGNMDIYSFMTVNAGTEYVGFTLVQNTSGLT